MKKNFRRVLAFALVAILALAVFAACGKTDDGNTKPADASQNADEGSAGKGGTLVIGATGPLTGDAASYGIGVKYGAQLAVDEINAAGGINGIKIEFMMEDDQLLDTVAQAAYGTLKDGGMQVAIGSVTSGACTAFKAEAQQYGLFFISPSATAVAAIEGYEKAFRVCFSDPNQGGVSAEYIAKSLTDVTKVATLYDSSSDYSKGIHDNFAAAITENGYGFEIVVDEAFTSDSNTDFSVQLQKIKDADCDLLFLPIYYQEASSIITQANSLGLEITVFGCDGLDGIITQLGDKADLAEGVMLLTPFTANGTDEKTVAFVNAYKAKYGDDNAYLNQFCADAYDAIYIIKQAIEEAGITSIDENTDISELGDKLTAALTSMTFSGVTGDNCTWSADGEPSKSPKAVVIQGGEYIAAD